MTKNFFTLLFICLALFAYSQPKKEYYDAEQLKLKSETNIVKGMPHGKHVEYYKSGIISRKGSFYSGKEDSTWYFYYETGNLKASENYFRGKKNGHNRYGNQQYLCKQCGTCRVLKPQKKHLSVKNSLKRQENVSV